MDAGGAWSGLQFRRLPAAAVQEGTHRRLLLAGSSLAAHGLLLAALMHWGSPVRVSGNAQESQVRVQLHFVPLDAPLRERGTGTAVPVPPVQLPAPQQPMLQRPQPLSAALPPPSSAGEHLPPAPPATTEAAAVATLRPSATSALATAPADTTPAQQRQGHGHALHGQGTAARRSAPQAVVAGEADWSQAVMRRLERFRSYPPAARSQRIEGVVLVQATIAADGQVLATRLRHSCGNPDLDAEALATFSRARRLPPPPAHLPSPLQVDLPVAFRLRS